jgi:tripartite-type tricarboxylate transporter receptor subunit TctC
MRFTRLVVTIALPLVAAIAPGVDAQTFPHRPIRLVAPFPPGGTADAIARAVSNEVGNQLGQTFVIDNRSGANGIIGTDIVAKAIPDGHTLLHVTGSFVINPSIYRKLPYDIFRDFVPVTNVVLGDGYLLLANPSVPAASVAELIDLARKGTRLTYSSPGIGNTLHLAGELFNVRAGTQLVHVPYKGVAPAMNAVLAGEAHVTFMPPTVALPLVKAGKLKALGFTGKARWPAMPELPTMSESGVPDLELSGSWHGWFAPANTPSPIVHRLQAELKKALDVPKVREYIINGGYQPDGRSPEEFRVFVRAEFKRYAEMVRIAKIQPQ